MLWTPLFFGLKRPVEATVDIVALTGIVGYLTYIWSGVDQVAAWALVPYLGWLSFATYLCVSNTTIITLSPCLWASVARYRSSINLKNGPLTGMIMNLGFHRALEQLGYLR